MLRPPPDLSQVLRRFSHRLAMEDIVEAAVHVGFSGARVWRLATGNAAWALRQWPRGSLPAERIRGLHRLLSHIAGLGLECIAVPVADDRGDTLIAEDSHQWQLEPWLPGTADFHRDPNPTRLASAMKVLAGWHCAAATFSPTEDTRRWFASYPVAPSPAVGERLQLWRQSQPVLAQAKSTVQKLLPEEWQKLCADAIRLIEFLGPKIATELVQSQDRAVPLQPCLRDVWHDHVLFTGDVVTGLVDPSACRTESVAADLARLVGSMIGDDAAAWDAALTTYRQLRPLSMAEESLIGVLDRSGVVLSGLTWLNWLFVERRSFPDAAAVRERVQCLHRRLVRLAQRG